MVRPYLIHIDTAQQTALIDAVDQALSQQIRSVLHHPAFQRLEAAWRSVRWLVESTETGAQLKIHMVQLTKEELQQDLAASPILAESGLARLLLEPASVPGTPSAALLIGNYAFAHTPEDLALLMRLGGIAQRLGAPFVASVSPHLLGCASFTEIASASELVRRFQEASYGEWQTFRRAAEARWVVLALPRVLLRLPYGSETEPIDSFAFEEQVSGNDHEQLLWGNPAFALGLVVARAFAERGWGLDLGRSVQRLEGLPLYIYHAGGTALTKPCAEVLLSERTAQVLMEIGLVPLISHRNADIIALPCLQSLAEPRSPLTWTG
jgi:type VI secretion system protein ImpC